MKHLTALFIFLTLSTWTFSQTDYKSFLQGTFEYCNNDTGATVTIKGTKAIERYKHSDGSTVTVYSKMKWISDNSYQITAKKIKGNAPFKKGDGFIVKITSLENNELQYTYQFNNGMKGSECFRKISE